MGANNHYNFDRHEYNNTLQGVKLTGNCQGLGLFIQVIIALVALCIYGLYRLYKHYSKKDERESNEEMIVNNIKSEFNNIEKIVIYTKSKKTEVHHNA